METEVAPRGKVVLYFSHVSSIQNLLFRLALRNDLNLLLDKKKNALPVKISKAQKRLSKVDWHKDFKNERLYHVMGLHTHFDYEGAK